MPGTTGTSARPARGPSCGDSSSWRLRAAPLAGRPGATSAVRPSARNADSNVCANEVASRRRGARAGVHRGRREGVPAVLPRSHPDQARVVSVVDVVRGFVVGLDQAARGGRPPGHSSLSWCTSGDRLNGRARPHPARPLAAVPVQYQAQAGARVTRLDQSREYKTVQQMLLALSRDARAGEPAPVPGIKNMKGTIMGLAILLAACHQGGAS